MGIEIFWMVLLLVATVIVGNLNIRNKQINARKKQSENLLRENVLRKRMVSITENRVKYTKRYKIETLCLQAGFKLAYADFILMSLASAIVFAVLVTIVSSNILLGIMFFFVGYIAPKQLFMFLKNRRIARMERQLGPAMQMMIRRYNATKDFSKSLELTTVEFEGQAPIYNELRKTLLEIQLGIPVGDALENMARRIGNKYMYRFADYYKIASSIGTDELRENLLVQAYTQFEENRRAKSSMKKELAEPVREAYIMLATIPLFALYQVATNSNYIPFMTQTTIGRIGTAAITAIFIGVLWFVNAKVGAPLE